MNPKLIEDLKTATADLATARRKRTDAERAQRLGMASDLAFSVAAEHGAFQRWLRASDAFNR